MSAVETLEGWLQARLERAAADWLREATSGADASDRAFFLAMGRIPQRVGKASLALEAAELAQAHATRPGWDPTDWTLDQAARIYLLCRSASEPARFADRLERLFTAADLGEAQAYYRGLPLYPDPPRYRLRAEEGVRSNVRLLFESVAHRNPYPSEVFGDTAWNQMVLKALFVGAPLGSIVGLDGRANPALAHMLIDYARERWAARRAVNPELWRCVAPFAKGRMLDDFGKLLSLGTEADRQVALAALGRAPDPGKPTR